jgi:hypothetical protein
VTAAVAQQPVPEPPLAHKPELFDNPEHTIVCAVCARLGKVVEVVSSTRTVQITIWYSGISYTGGPAYSAAKTCDGNTNWLEADPLVGVGVRL